MTLVLQAPVALPLTAGEALASGVATPFGQARVGCGGLLLNGGILRGLLHQAAAGALQEGRGQGEEV